MATRLPSSFYNGLIPRVIAGKPRWRELLGAYGLRTNVRHKETQRTFALGFFWLPGLDSNQRPID